MNQRIIPFLLLLLLLALTVSGCNIGKDNSPDTYVPDGPGGTVFDTTGMPQFSHAPGVYFDAITVSLTTTDESYTIRYTTDCSTPSALSKEYTEPLAMNHSSFTDDDTGVSMFNIRAASFDRDGNMVGRVVSASYLFPESKDRFTTRVISIITDDDNLNKPNYGLIAYPHGRGKAWERPVNFQLYGVDGKLRAQQDLGMRVNGTGSRKNAQLNFRLFARKDYTIETGHLNYPLFPGLLSEYSSAQIDEFDTFLVRGGASNFRNSMITNLVAYEMMDDSAVDSADFEPAALYLNGQYYGLMMVIEDYGPYYFESHYGVDENKVTTLNYTVLTNDSLGWELDDCTEIEASEWSKVRHFVEDNDMTDPDNYARACEILDMQNYIEYIAYECYVNNWDWPRNNVRVWRYNGVNADNSLSGMTGGYDPDAEIGFDGRWRYVLKDIDVSMGVNVKPEKDYWSRNDVDFFQVLFKDGRVSSLSTMFSSLIQNKSFARDFFLYVCKMMSTTCSPEQFLAVIDTLALQVSEEMKYHSEQYGDSLDEWDRHLQCMRTFALVRPQIVLDNFKANPHGVPNIPKIVKLTFKVGKGGLVSFNGASFGDGDYAYAFKAEDMAIAFLPDEGYEVDKVTIQGGSYYDDDLSIYLRGDSPKLTVTFRKIDGYTPPAEEEKHPVLNEIGHSSLERVNGYDWVELFNPTDTDVNLKDWSISNGLETYTFPELFLKAGDFKVIFLSGTKDGGVYAPFTISSDDVISISNDRGELVDSVQILTRSSTAHLGRYPDGGDWVELSRTSITPSAPNLHLTEFEHYFDDRIQNTMMINGVLQKKSLFSLNENGDLTIEKKNLAHLVCDNTFAIETFTDYFKHSGDDEVLNLTEWFKNPITTKYGGFFYVESLNSCVVSLHK